MKFNLNINQLAIIKSGIEIDIVDAVIIDFLITFSKSESIVKIKQNDVDFFWFSYDKIISELPLLKLKKDSIYRRMKNLSEIGLLIQFEQSKQMGRSFFGITAKCFELIFIESETNPNIGNKSDVVDLIPNVRKIKQTTSDSEPMNNSTNNNILFSEENNVPKKSTSKRSTSKKPVVKKTEEKDSCPVYKEAVAIYFSFYKDLNGINPKFDVADGKSMKTLISYFKSVHKDKNDGSDQKQYVLQNLKYIFDNWNKQVDFIRNQTRMTQINSNINNIINKLKSGKSTSNNGNGGNKIVGKSQKFTIDEFVKSSSNSEK